MRRSLGSNGWLVAILATGVLAACGQSDRLTGAELAAKGNAICARSDTRLEKVFKEDFPEDAEPTPAQIQSLVRKIVPIFNDTVAELGDLVPPEDVEKKFDAAISQADDAIAKLKTGTATPEAAQKLFAGDEDPFEEANKSLEALGITKCSDDEDEGDEGAEGAVEEADPDAAIVTFEATEYRFSGPATVEAGKVAISMVNKGQEAHEMGIVKLKEGVTAQQVIEAEGAGNATDELIADDDVGAVRAVDAGGTGVANVELGTGTYGYACFIDAPDGKPHAEKGMFGEFTVA